MSLLQPIISHNLAPNNRFYYKCQLNTYQSVEKWYKKSLNIVSYYEDGSLLIVNPLITKRLSLLSVDIYNIKVYIIRIMMICENQIFTASLHKLTGNGPVTFAVMI